MPRDVLDLAASTWELGRAGRQPFSSHPFDDRSQVTSWLPARVPGDVRLDLLAAGVIPSTKHPDDLATGAWVDACDWWYRTKLDAIEDSVTAVLEADGIDYLSSIWLDNHCLATHAGMAARQSIVLSPYLNEPGVHDLAIRLWGADALPITPDSRLRRNIRRLLARLGVATEYFPDRMATPKAQFNFGWDFSPRVRSTGIWDDIRLTRVRGAYLKDIRVCATPLTEDEDPTPVRWQVQLQIQRFDEKSLRVEITLCAQKSGELLAETGPLPLTGTADPIITLETPSTRRWWPWDQGEPYLYRVAVRLIDERGVVDEVEVEVGVRSVERQSFENGQPWRWVVNGRHVFLRGANWVPVDVLPGKATARDYAALLNQARMTGVNFLRIWGGGIREKRPFWEQCNRLGIMAIQEFPLACAFLDHYPRDPVYLEVLESEARGTVRLLRNHPALIAWCGGNEISPRRERVPLRTIRQALTNEDDTRPWIPASPSAGDIHQWDVWHGQAPWQSLARVRASFVSEFGLQALPHLGSVAAMFPAGAPRSLSDAGWEHRKLQADKLRHYAGPLDESDLASTILATQRVQATALQVGIEACRMRREGAGNCRPCGGVAFWQFNEPWPAVSWSIIDRYGRPKLAYEMLQRSYQPLLVAARFTWRQWQRGDTFSADVWLVNDGPTRYSDCRIEAAIDETTVWHTGGQEILPNAARSAGRFSTTLQGSPAVLAFALFQGDEMLAVNRYDLAVYQPPPQPLRAWLLRRLGDRLLRIG